MWLVEGRNRYPVTVEPLTDEAVNARVDDACRAKYAGQAPVRDITSEHARLYVPAQSAVGVDAVR
jgi:hypothetical protein